MTLAGYVEETCINCGIVFPMRESHISQLRRSEATFYCPNGHGQVYKAGPTEADKLRVEINRLRSEIADYQRWLSESNAKLSNERKKFRCVVTGCDHWCMTKHSARLHLEREHNIREHTFALPSDAGPDAKNSEVG
jgi:hypothetical protein